MPALSKKQSRFLNWKFGHAWVSAHHFDNPTSGLPQHVPRQVVAKRRKRVRVRRTNT